MASVFYTCDYKIFWNYDIAKFKNQKKEDGRRERWRKEEGGRERWRGGVKYGYVHRTVSMKDMKSVLLILVIKWTIFQFFLSFYFLL